MTFTLAELLGGRPLYQVWGLIEGLFQFAAKHAQDGVLSRFSCAQIARQLHWDGNDPDFLVSAMVKAGILCAHTCCDEHRLMVADWQSNMPEMTRKYLKRNQLEVMTSCGDKKRTRSARRPPRVRTASAAKTDNVHIEPNRTEPNLTEPKRTELNQTEPNRTEQGDPPAAAAGAAIGGGSPVGASASSSGSASERPSDRDPVGSASGIGTTASVVGDGVGRAVALAAELHGLLRLGTLEDVRAGRLDKRQFDVDMAELRDKYAPLILADGRVAEAKKQAVQASTADTPMAAFIHRLKREGYEVPGRNGARGHGLGVR